MTATTDVVRRFESGDSGAVSELYREYGRPMFSIAFHQLRDRGLAEEAVQQAFLQAWKSSSTFDTSRNIAPWLYTITRRVAIDLYRRERRHQSQEILDKDVAELGTGIESAWTVWEVRKALDDVPEDERVVVEATHFLGLTHQQTADHLAIPIGTVKSRSARAHKRLAQKLAHLQEEAS